MKKRSGLFPGIMKTITAISVIILLTACSQQGNDGSRDTPTSGSIRIAVDESLMPVIDAEVKAFEAIYPSAHITVLEVSEADAIRLLIADSVRLAIITRSLNDVERQHMLDQHITPHDETVARESIAIILNPAAKDSTFSLPELTALFSKEGEHRIVFDNPKSGVVRYVKDSLLPGREFSSSTYSLNGSEAVIEYVSREKDAIGLIGGAWIGDRDDSTTNKFLASIRVAAIEHDGEFYQPYQAYVARRLYPLARDIVMVSREARSGLGTGFMSFVAGDKGQRVILKAGLLPVTMPVRIVEISHEPL
jgi:phosphate transport system substrate-binding protein